MTNTAERLLADIREVAPDITLRAAEIESARRIPLDLVEMLRSIGVFRMFVPQSHGGLELDLPSALEIIGALGRIDGSVGWTAAIANGADLFAPLLPRATYDQVYEHGPDVIIAGTAQPAGTAEADAGGWRVNGRWPFASGCQHADWMFGLCVVTEGGTPVLGEAGAPLVRGFFLPAHNWQIEDTWYVAGLKGTGSHHIVLKDTVIPAANFFDLVSSVPCLPGPLYQAVRHLLPLIHGAVSVGLAAGALDDLVVMVDTGRQQLGAVRPMRESETFQGELGRVAAELSAARALLEVQVTSHWHHAIAGTLKDEALLTQGTRTAIWLATTCVRVGHACFALGGSSALYETSPLQRRLRDLHAAAQHAVAQQRHYVSAGKLLLSKSAGSSRILDGRRARRWEHAQPGDLHCPGHNGRSLTPQTGDNMDARRAPLQATIVKPEQALPLKAFGLDLRVLLTTEATGGAIAVLMGWHKPGEGPSDHVHFSQEEIFFILEGTYELTVGDQTTTAGPGTIVFIPRNVVHRFKNVGDTTACMLDWSLPGGQDRYFKAISELGAGGGFTSEKVTEINEKFDTTFLAGH